MNLERFMASRPYAYHLTARWNIPGIRHGRALLSAGRLASRPSEVAILGERRVDSVALEEALIRDQRPLHRGNIDLAPGFSFEQLLALLNSLVFFWPGTRKGPIDYGQRHFKRYEPESPTLLRILVSDLLTENPQLALVSRYNSGSPRCSGGRKSPRGPLTFGPIAQFSGTPSQVVELAFADTARLPASAETGDSPSGPWAPLF